MTVIDKATCKDLLTEAFTYFPASAKGNTMSDVTSLAPADFDALAMYIAETIGTTVTGKTLRSLLNGAGVKNPSVNILCAFLLVKKGVITSDETFPKDRDVDNRYYVRRYFEHTTEASLREDTPIQQITQRTTQLDDSGKSKFSDKKYMYGFLGLLLLIIVVSVAVYSSSKEETSIPEMKISVVENSANFPKEIKVAYDLKSEEFLKNSKISFMTTPILLNKLQGVVSLTAPYPNLYWISLFNKDKSFDAQGVLLPSDGWMGFLNTYQPLPKEAWWANGLMHLKAISNEQKLPNQDYYSNFLNFKNFGVEGESFTLEADLKNPPAEGSPWAHDVSVDIVGFKTSVTFNFLSPDGIQYANLIVGDTDFKIGNKQQVLQKLGVLFPEWTHLTVSCRDKKINIMLDNTTIINESYEGEIGQIVGLQFFFKGSGYLKNVTLNGMPV